MDEGRALTPLTNHESVIHSCGRLRALRRVGNLPRVSKRLPISIGVVLLLAVAAWLIVRSCAPERESVAPATPAPRQTFDPSRPLQVDVFATRAADGATAEVEWLEPELTRLMRLNGLQAARTTGGALRSGAYLLRVAVAPQSKQALLALIAPDQVLERERTVRVEDPARLAMVATLARELPGFLRLGRAKADWSALLGTDDARAYDAFTRAAAEILGREGRGYTRPPRTSGRSRTLERLESLARSQPRFTRARELLSVGYLSLGGEDEASLAQLASANAERVISRDANSPDAHAALGLAALRKAEWIRAREHFDMALKLNPENAPALEGLACLLTDAGLFEAARPLAERAIALQPRNLGANECLAYAAKDVTADPAASAAAAHASALKAILRGDSAEAERLFRASLRPAQFDLWARPVLRASSSPAQVPRALRAVTRAANEDYIDASTEILCGAALREADFVMNRISRLQRRDAHTPLRILWLEDAVFLREHPAFDEIISNTGLPTFWQEHGAPDICRAEPDTYGCAPRAARGAQP